MNKSLFIYFIILALLCAGFVAGARMLALANPALVGADAEVQQLVSGRLGWSIKVLRLEGSPSCWAGRFRVMISFARRI